MITEIMIKCMANEIRDGDIFFGHGLISPLATIASNLAKRTHAPHAVYLSVTEGVDARPDKVTVSTGDPKLTEGSVAYMRQVDIFDMAQKGEIDLMFFSGAQIDKHGNWNLCVIGDYYRPKVRLGGGAASAYFSGVVRRIVLWTTRHNKRTFVEKVDCITGHGYYVMKVITNLCVLSHEKDTMKLETVHPGISVDEVVENTGFDLEIPESVKETEKPTGEDLRIIDEIDPDRMRDLEF